MESSSASTSTQSQTINDGIAATPGGGVPIPAGRAGGFPNGNGQPPIRAVNLYVVDAQGFTINGEFHPRELWITNVLMSWGLELDLDISHRALQNIPIADFNTCSRQTDNIHGLHFRAKRHSMNRPLIGSKSAGRVLSFLYEMFKECAGNGELPVFCVKNHALLQLLKSQKNIERIVNLDDPSFGFPNIETLESYYREWHTQCHCHQMPKRSSYRCSQSKTNIILTHLMKNSFLNIADREFESALGNMTAILDSRFFERLVKAGIEAYSLAQPGGITPQNSKQNGQHSNDQGSPSNDPKPGASGEKVIDENVLKMDASWTTNVEPIDERPRRVGGEPRQHSQTPTSSLSASATPKAPEQGQIIFEEEQENEYGNERSLDAGVRGRYKRNINLGLPTVDANDYRFIGPYFESRFGY